MFVYPLSPIAKEKIHDESICMTLHKKKKNIERLDYIGQISHQMISCCIQETLEIRNFEYNINNFHKKLHKYDKMSLNCKLYRHCMSINLLCVCVCVCIYCSKHRKKKTNFFVVSLAFVDLLVALVVMPLAAIELTTGQWSYGDTFCLVRTSLDVQLTTVSILHLCCIALDR